MSFVITDENIIRCKSLLIIEYSPLHILLAIVVLFNAIWSEPVSGIWPKLLNILDKHGNLITLLIPESGCGLWSSCSSRWLFWNYL